MKKKVKDFLKYIENETQITFDWLNLQPTEKYVQRNKQPIERNTLTVNDGQLIMMVCSCGCTKCKQILALQFFYGLNDSTLFDAECVMNQIKDIVPQMPIKIYDLFDLESIAS